MTPIVSDVERCAGDRAGAPGPTMIEVRAGAQDSRSFAARRRRAHRVYVDRLGVIWAAGAG
jgi:hypothetical protein